MVGSWCFLHFMQLMILQVDSSYLDLLRVCHEKTAFFWLHSNMMTWDRLSSWAPGPDVGPSVVGLGVGVQKKNKNVYTLGWVWIRPVVGLYHQSHLAFFVGLMLKLDSLCIKVTQLETSGRFGLFFIIFWVDSLERFVLAGIDRNVMI